jgi:hypothetical protein
VSTPSKSIVVIGDLEEEGADVIIRGHIAREAISLLQTGTYQRSANFSPAKTKRLVKAIMAGKIRRFPDIILGMRGHHWDSIQKGIALRDAVYIIDGVQRTFAWKLATDEEPDKGYVLGVKVYINTNQEIETAMFRELNTGHTAMAPSVILRNEKEHSRVAAMLYGLSHQAGFVLKDRVCWDQAMNKSTNGDIIKGAQLLHLIRALHGHKLQGNETSRGGGGVLDILDSTDNQIDNIGLMKARQNMATFFDAVDEAWGIKNITTVKSLPHMHWGWLNTFARIFSDHLEFWKDADSTVLHISSSVVHNLKTKIDPSDASLMVLSRGNREAREVLYEMMVKRINRQGLTDRYQVRKEKQQAEDDDQPGATT